MPRAFVLVLAGLLAGTPAAASERDAPPASAAAEPPMVFVAAPNPSRGAVLPFLYAGLAGLQSYDIYSTHEALRRGAVERNPIMAGAVGSQAVMFGVKAAVTTATIVTAERLWRQHRRTQAIVTLVAANSVMAAVAANNAAVLRGMK